MIKRAKISQKDEEALVSIPRDPLIEVDDQFDYSKVVIEKPWGHEYSIFKNDDVDVWYLFLKPGHKTSMHCHPHKMTSLIVLGGEVAFSTLNSKTHLKTGDGFIIDRSVFHSTEAVSPHGAYVLESETPVNKKNLVRLDDLYGRSGKRYESGRHVQSRDPRALFSFHEKENRFEPKQFGESHLALAHFADNGRFASALPNINATAAVVLSGKICSDGGETLFGRGELIDMDTVKSARVFTPDAVEFLLIRKS